MARAHFGLRGADAAKPATPPSEVAFVEGGAKTAFNCCAPSLFRVILRSFGASILWSALLKFCGDMLVFVNPVILRQANGFWRLLSNDLV